VNERAVVRLERDPQVELQDSVGSEERPIAAAREHHAAEARAFEVPARNGSGDASAVRHRPDPLRADDGDLQGHQEAKVHWSTAPPFTATTAIETSVGGAAPVEASP
jgi:hypothetical protein